MKTSGGQFSMSTEVQVWKDDDGLVFKRLRFKGTTQGEFLKLLATQESNPKFVPLAHNPNENFVMFGLKAIYRSAFETYVEEIGKAFGLQIRKEPPTE